MHKSINYSIHPYKYPSYVTLFEKSSLGERFEKMGKNTCLLYTVDSSAAFCNLLSSNFSGTLPKLMPCTLSYFSGQVLVFWSWDHQSQLNPLKFPCLATQLSWHGNQLVRRAALWSMCLPFQCLNCHHSGPGSLSLLRLSERWCTLTVAIPCCISKVQQMAKHHHYT